MDLNDQEHASRFVLKSNLQVYVSGGGVRHLQVQLHDGVREQASSVFFHFLENFAPGIEVREQASAKVI
jgi:hypothetical protein